MGNVKHGSVSINSEIMINGVIIAFMKGKIFIVCLTGIFILSCKTNDLTGLDFRQEMRNLVIDLSAYGRNTDAGFIIVPQNGQEIASTSGEGGGDFYWTYLASLDGTGQEDLNYGYTGDKEATPKYDFLTALQGTNYDLLIIDLFCCGKELTASDIQSLKTKQNGGSRLVLCYMSIGEAENYRWYWQSAWHSYPPPWLEKENPDWPGNYKVRYWNEEWQSILMGFSDSYLDKILNAGFDGAYLDIIDAFEYFENL